MCACTSMQDFQDHYAGKFLKQMVHWSTKYAIMTHLHWAGQDINAIASLPCTAAAQNAPDNDKYYAVLMSQSCTGCYLYIFLVLQFHVLLSLYHGMCMCAYTHLVLSKVQGCLLQVKRIGTRVGIAKLLSCYAWYGREVPMGNKNRKPDK